MSPFDGDEKTRRGSAPQIGFTLLELVIVLGILAVVALVAFPRIEATQPYRLDVAATELAAAIRFARVEAMRMASPYGVQVKPSPKKVRVFRGSGSKLAPTPVYDVLDPVSKRPYEFDFDDQATTRRLELTVVSSWSGDCDDPELLGFDEAGTPRCGDPWDVLLGTSTLTLSHAGRTRNVIVDGETGRVRVQ